MKEEKFMKKVRKGFTLIELLIVVAIIGALSAMMAASSSESIDASAAAAILNNLQTMKVAAFEMYQEVPEVASINTATTPITGTSPVTIGTDSKTVAKVLGERLGRLDIPANYGLIGDETNGWYVYYNLQTSDTANARAKLSAAANRAGLIGLTAASPTATNVFVADDIGYYDSAAETTQNCIALRVR